MLAELVKSAFGIWDFIFERIKEGKCKICTYFGLCTQTEPSPHPSPQPDETTSLVE